MTGVSFVVTVYNKARFLPAVLGAIFAQEGDFAREIIIVDDGSTDDSAALLARLCAGRANVRIVRQKNAGLVAATNTAVAAARLPWLKVVDGDDVLAPWCTRLLLDAAYRLGARIAVGRGTLYRLGEAINFGALDPVRATPRRRDLFTECLKNVPCNLAPTLLERAVYWDVGGADPRLYNVDFPLLLKASRGHVVATVDAIVSASPEVAPGRMSGDERRMLLETNRAIALFLAETPGLPFAVRYAAVERAFGRAWKWQHRRHGASMVSRWFWLYVLAKLTPPSVTAPFLPKTLEAFTPTGRP